MEPQVDMRTFAYLTMAWPVLGNVVLMPLQITPGATTETSPLCRQRDVLKAKPILLSWTDDCDPRTSH
jgi:hypothetical protein